MAEWYACSFYCNCQLYPPCSAENPDAQAHTLVETLIYIHPCTYMSRLDFQLIRLDSSFFFVAAGGCVPLQSYPVINFVFVRIRPFPCFSFHSLPRRSSFVQQQNLLAEGDEKFLKLRAVSFIRRLRLLFYVQTEGDANSQRTRSVSTLVYRISIVSTGVVLVRFSVLSRFFLGVSGVWGYEVVEKGSWVLGRVSLYWDRECSSRPTMHCSDMTMLHGVRVPWPNARIRNRVS